MSTRTPIDQQTDFVSRLVRATRPLLAALGGAPDGITPEIAADILALMDVAEGHLGAVDSEVEPPEAAAQPASHLRAVGTRTIGPRPVVRTGREMARAIDRARHRAAVA